MSAVLDGPTITHRLTGVEIRELCEQSPEAARGIVYLSAACPLFEGHFPGHPVLPGVGQLALVLEIAERVWGSLTVTGVERIKFTRSVRPETELHLGLTRHGAQLRFRLCCEAGRCEVSQGILWLAEDAAQPS